MKDGIAKRRAEADHGWKPDFECNHDGAFALSEKVPKLRYCPRCGLLETGTHGKWPIYMHPDVFKEDIAQLEAREPIDWEALWQAIAEISAKGSEAGEPYKEG